MKTELFGLSSSQSLSEYYDAPISISSPTANLAYYRKNWIEKSVREHNFHVAAGATNMAVEIVVGKGFEILPQVTIEGNTPEQNKVINDQIKRLWDKWEEEASLTKSDLTSFLKSVVKEILVFGDCGVLITGNKNAKGIQIRLDSINAKRIDSPGSKLKGPVTEVMGVKVSSKVPVGYFVKHNVGSKEDFVYFERDNKDGEMVFRLLTNPLDVLEAEVYRGRPVLAPGIQIAKQTRQLLEAELNRAKALTNQFAVFKSNKLPTTSAAPIISQKGADDLNIFMTDTSSSIDISDASKSTNPNFPSVFGTFLGQVAQLYNQSKEVLFNDISGLSYGAVKAAQKNAYENYTPWRTYLTKQVLIPFYRRWLKEACARGLIEGLEYSDEVANSVQFISTPASSFSLKEELDSNQTAIEMGLRSTVSICREKGLDAYQIALEESDLQQAKEQLARERGIVPIDKDKLESINSIITSFTSFKIPRVTAKVMLTELLKLSDELAEKLLGANQ